MEAVNHPKHYNIGKIEVIDFVEDQNLNFSLGNAVKYICRCEHKGKKEEDLKKAIWYIQHELNKLTVEPVAEKKKSARVPLNEQKC